MDRAAAVDRLVGLLDRIESHPTPVPVREVWVYGDCALGLDPVDRLDIYVTKDLLLDGDESREPEFREQYGVRGVGETVDTTWAEHNPDALRTTDAGYAAPAKCLAAHLLDPDEAVHLEVCNASFDDNVTRRLEGALAHDAYDEVLDPRGVQLWADGTRDEAALDRLRDGSLTFPTLSGALEMLGVESERAGAVAAAVRERRDRTTGRTVRSDVV